MHVVHHVYRRFLCIHGKHITDNGIMEEEIMTGKQNYKILKKIRGQIAAQFL